MSSARTRGTTPDLFSHAPAREPSSPSQNPPSASLVIAKAVNNLASPQHVLPKNLAAAVKHLTDQELDNYFPQFSMNRSGAATDHQNKFRTSGGSKLALVRSRVVRSTPYVQRSKQV